MTLHVDLPPDLEGILVEQAQRLGLSLPDYALHVLSSAQVSLTRTSAEVMDYWEREGVVGSRGDIADSQEHARRLREEAQRRTRDA